MKEIKFEFILKIIKDGTICHWYFTLEGLMKGQFNSMIDERYELIAKRMFTGLKDKNGKEIYEGDILSSTVNGIVKVVVYSESKAMFIIDYESQGYVNFMDIEGEEIEVIGNIYENPELIENKGGSEE